MNSSRSKSQDQWNQIRTSTYPRRRGGVPPPRSEHRRSRRPPPQRRHPRPRPRHLAGRKRGPRSAPALLSACFPHTGRAIRIGITGSPGAGKSTLVDRLARAFRETPEGRDAGKTVGVVAVDPTSPFTGGAILGDRVPASRNDSPTPASMPAAWPTAAPSADSPSPPPTSPSYSKPAAKTFSSSKPLASVEVEIEIARLADVTLVVLVPGMGDNVQSLKAGVMGNRRHLRRQQVRP